MLRSRRTCASVCQPAVAADERVDRFGSSWSLDGAERVRKTERGRARDGRKTGCPARIATSENIDPVNARMLSSSVMPSNKVLQRMTTLPRFARAGSHRRLAAASARLAGDHDQV